MTVFGFERGGLAQAARFERAVARAGRARARPRRGLRPDDAAEGRAGADRGARLPAHRPAQPDAGAARAAAPGPEASLTKLYWSEMDKRIQETAVGRAGPVRRARAGVAVRARGRALAVRLDVVAGGDDLRRLVRDPAQHHRRARARACREAGEHHGVGRRAAARAHRRRRAARRARWSRPATSSDSPRRSATPTRAGSTEAPPTFLVALAPVSLHLAGGRGVRQGLAERRQPLRVPGAGQGRRHDHRDRQGGRRLREERGRAATCCSSSSRPSTSTSTGALVARLRGTAIRR